eukprot:137417-Chlamydomonas_euryale.AAC.8
MSAFLGQSLASRSDQGSCVPGKAVGFQRQRSFKQAPEQRTCTILNDEGATKAVDVALMLVPPSALNGAQQPELNRPSQGQHLCTNIGALPHKVLSDHLLNLSVACIDTVSHLLPERQHWEVVRLKGALFVIILSKKFDMTLMLKSTLHHNNPHPRLIEESDFAATVTISGLHLHMMCSEGGSFAAPPRVERLSAGLKLLETRVLEMLEQQYAPNDAVDTALLQAVGVAWDVLARDADPCSGKDMHLPAAKQCAVNILKFICE